MNSSGRIIFLTPSQMLDVKFIEAVKRAYPGIAVVESTSLPTFTATHIPLSGNG